MGKQRKPEEREETRKQTVWRRRDTEMNRRVMMGLAAVAILVVGLLAAGTAQELFFKPRQPVAVVNGTSITQQDYAKRVRFDWFRSSQFNQPVSDPQGSSVQVLDQMVDEVLIREQAQQKGITASPEEITTAIEESFGYQANPSTPEPTLTPVPTETPGPGTPAPTSGPTETPFPTPTPMTREAYQEAYTNYMKTLEQAAGMTEQDFRRLVEGDVLQRKLYDQVSADVPTTEEQLKLRHILVAIRTPAPTPAPTPTGQPSTPEPSPTTLPTGAPTPAPSPTPSPTPAPRTDEEALARIKEAEEKLKAGTDFAEVAKEYSDDTYSAQQGGELGWYGRGGGLVKEFEDAAFQLQPGQLSEPVKTEFGYHLIQVEERDPNHPLDDYTLQQRKYEAYTKWLEDLRQKATIERFWSPDKVPPTPNLQPAS